MTTANDLPAALEDLRTLVHSIAAGVDRRDAGMLAAAYHHDSVHHHGDVEIPGPEFAGWAVDYLKECIASQHLVTNHDFLVEGPRASGTMRFLATELWPGATASTTVIRTYHGSYADEYVLDAGVWQLLARRVHLGWQRTDLVASESLTLSS